MLDMLASLQSFGRSPVSINTWKIFCIIKQEGLDKLLSKVNPSTSSGPDNIPNIILKECAVQLAPILQKIFQVSINTADLPKNWRDANISNIFKKGDKHLPENYRSVSLTSVPCSNFSGC
jgi:hypothetical protein